MLDEDEYKIVSDLYYECIRSVKTYRQLNNVPLQETPVDKLFEPVRIEYERMTGMPNCHQNAIMHHKISIYGETCTTCGKPLRTPYAKMCASCGAKVNEK